MDTSEYCLAHLFTNRDFGCIAGLAHVGTVCSNFANTGLTKISKKNVSLIILRTFDLIMISLPCDNAQMMSFYYIKEGRNYWYFCT